MGLTCVTMHANHAPSSLLPTDSPSYLCSRPEKTQYYAEGSASTAYLSSAKHGFPLQLHIALATYRKKKKTNTAVPTPATRCPNKCLDVWGSSMLNRSSVGCCDIHDPTSSYSDSRRLPGVCSEFISVRLIVVKAGVKGQRCTAGQVPLCSEGIYSACFWVRFICVFGDVV